MELGLEGKAALIGGSSKGIGRAIAAELAASGADIVICARGGEGLEAAANELSAGARGQVKAIATDLSDPDAVARLVAESIESLGRIDVLVTNTGGPPAGTFDQHSAEAWRAAVSQNLESVLNLSRAVLPGMKARRFGRIINVTSIAVKQPVDGLILSNSVRAAVTGFARTLANEVARDGVTVNNVLPGFTQTERLDELADRIAAERGVSAAEARADWEAQIPMGRLGRPNELAALVAFLASERASYITGTSIPVDGGWTRSLL